MFLFFGPTGKPRHLATLALVLLLTLLLAVRSSGGWFSYTSAGLIALVLPIAGTIVALALPAAQLAQSVLDRFLATAEGLIQANEPLHGIHDHLLKEAQGHRRMLGATRSMVLYGLASLLTGLAGALGWAGGKQVQSSLAVADALAALSTSLLVASVLWFVPVLRSAFDFSSGDRLLGLLQAQKQAPAKAVPVAKGGPTGGAGAGAEAGAAIKTAP